MNSVKLANILLIIVVVIMVGSIVTNIVTKKTITTNENGEQAVTTKFVGFSGEQAVKAA
ncbi:MAG: hypothetical protein M0R02_09245 [Bacteroidales bacterium]|nr:hypothetical protein [Bacteroidales bacterium]